MPDNDGLFGLLAVCALFGALGIVAIVMINSASKTASTIAYRAPLPAEVEYQVVRDERGNLRAMRAVRVEPPEPMYTRPIEALS